MVRNCRKLIWLGLAVLIVAGCGKSPPTEAVAEVAKPKTPSKPNPTPKHSLPTQPNPTKPPVITPAEVRPSMVVLAMTDLDGHTDRGAGFFLDRDLILCANPLLMKFPPKPNQSMWSEYSVVADDPSKFKSDWHTLSPSGPDHAYQFLVCHEPGTAPVVPLASADPVQGTSLTVLGYVAGANSSLEFKELPAKAGKLVRDIGTIYWIETDFEPPAGWLLGGPVLDADGKVVAMLTAPRPGAKTATLFPVESIRSYLKGHGQLFDIYRKNPHPKPVPKPKEPPLETGGLSLPAYEVVRNGVTTVMTTNQGAIINVANGFYFTPDRVLTRGKLHIGRGFTFKEDELVYSTASGDFDRLNGGAGAKPIFEDPVLDVAVISVPVPTRKPGLAWATPDAQKGDTVFLVDYQDRKRPTILKTTVAEVTEGKPTLAKLDLKLVDHNVRGIAAGQSKWRYGGPAVDATGKVVGIALPPAKDGENAILVPASVLRGMLVEKGEIKTDK